MRRTVALARVLTGTLLDGIDGRDTSGAGTSGAGEGGAADVRHRAAGALDALGITLTATGTATATPTATRPLAANPSHEPAGTVAGRRTAGGQAAQDGWERAGAGKPSPWQPRHGDAAGTLVVANHVSWLDIPALLALEPVRFLAKREVANWPFVGGQARRMGTLLLDRWSLRGLPSSVGAVTQHLRAGETVVAFPEATTWCNAPGGPFRRAVFQAAIDAGAPVRPVTLSYRQHGEPSTIAAFVGDDGLAASLARVVRARDLTIHAELHEPLEPIGDRRTLARRAQHAVQAETVQRPAIDTAADAGTVHV